MLSKFIALTDANGGLRSLSDIEEEYVAIAFAQNEQNASRTAAFLGIGRSTFYRRFRHIIDTRTGTDSRTGKRRPPNAHQSHKGISAQYP